MVLAWSMSLVGITGKANLCSRYRFFTGSPARAIYVPEISRIIGIYGP